MLKKFTKKKSLLDLEIESVFEEMKELGMDTEEYETRLGHLGRLYGLKDKDWTISPEAAATIGANLLGILLILNYERAHVLTTKAAGFILRGRV